MFLWSQAIVGDDVDANAFQWICCSDILLEDVPQLAIASVWSFHVIQQTNAVTIFAIGASCSNILFTLFKIRRAKRGQGIALSVALKVCSPKFCPFLREKKILKQQISCQRLV